MDAWIEYVTLVTDVLVLAENLAAPAESGDVSVLLSRFNALLWRLLLLCFRLLEYETAKRLGYSIRVYHRRRVLTALDSSESRLAAAPCRAGFSRAAESRMPSLAVGRRLASQSPAAVVQLRVPLRSPAACRVASCVGNGGNLGVAHPRASIRVDHGMV